MSKTPMRDIVVILPGITGSVLQKDGKDIWAVSEQSLWQALTSLGNSFQDLKLNGDDPHAEDLGDGIKATRLVADAHLIPGLVKIDGYTTLSRLINENFEVVQGNIFQNDKPANFFEFPYDWRRDSRANARLLKRLLDKQLKLWRESQNKDAKVILLGHSMGGLVARYYIEVLEGWRDCKALFTFGTPYRGSLNAVNFLANGYKKLFLDLTEVMRSLTTVYQLLPIYEMVKVGNKYQRIAETANLPNIVPEKAKDALAFHREIETAVNSHNQDEEYRNSHKTIPMVGRKQPTLQSASLVDGKLIAGSGLPLGIDPILGDGDGTVPYLSAIPIELSNEFRDIHVVETHGAIHKHSQVQEQLLYVLQTTQVGDLGGIRRSEKIKGISISVDDLYLPDEPVEIHARLVNFTRHPGGLKAEITPTTGEGTSLVADLQEQEQDWVLTVGDLAPGLYHLSVYVEDTDPQDPNAVHDIFEVIK